MVLHPNATSASVTTPALTNATTTAQTAAYSVNVSNGSCSATGNVSITVNPVPTISNQTVTAACNGLFTITPSAVPSGTTYTWTAPTYSAGTISGGSAQAAGQSTISQTLTNSGTTIETATYTVTPVSGTCTGSTFTITVTVNPIPSVSNQTVTAACNGLFTVAPSGVPTGTNYSWSTPIYSSVNVSGGSAQTGKPTISQTLSNSGTTTETATYTVIPVTGSCTGSSFTVTVTINPVPSVSNQTVTAACGTGSFTINPTNVPTGTTYSWSAPTYSAGTITGGSAQTGQTTISQSLSNSGTTIETATYTVTPLSGTCAGNSFTVIVTVDPVPSVNNQTTSTCSDAAFTVSPSGVPVGTTYTWTAPVYSGSISGGSSQATGQANISQTLTNSGTTAGTATYTVTPLSGICAGNTFTVTVTVNPKASVSDQTTTTCDLVAFSVTPSGVPAGTSYSWSTPVYSGSVSGGSAQSGQASISQTLNNGGTVPATATYTVTPLTGICNGTPFDVIVTINPSVAPIFSDAPTANTCSGFDVTYTVQSGMTNYAWNVPGVIGTDYTISAGGTGTTSNTVTLKWITAGTKSVTVNFTNSYNCSSPVPTTSNTIVTTSVAPSVNLTIVGGVNPTCQGGSVTFNAIPVNGGTSPTYAWYRNGVLVSSNNTSSYTATNITASTPVYVVMTVGAGICTSSPTATSATTTITIVSNSWTGSISNAWSDGRNWCAGTAPTAITDVSIPVTSRNPVIANSAAVKNINIAANASVTMSNCALTVNGIVTGTGTFGGFGNSGLLLAGPGNIGTLYFQPAGLTTLKLTGSGSTAGLGNATNIYGELNVGNNTLITNDLLTMKSIVSGTSWLAPVSGTNNVTGNVTVERYIGYHGHRAWRMLAIPTSGTQTIKAAWQEGQAAGANSVPGFGTLLTSLNAPTAGNGYDFQTSGNSLLTLTSGNPGNYVAVASTNSPIATTSGYMVFMRGDRGAAITNGIIGQNPTTLRTKGPLYQGTQPLITIPAQTNRMIGNIYASAIDFDRIIKTGISAFKLWDPNISGTSGVGAYITFSAINGYQPIPEGDSTSYGSTPNSRIESGQAFIVSGGASGGTLQLTEVAKTTGSRNVLRTNRTIEQLKQTCLLKMLPAGSWLMATQSCLMSCIHLMLPMMKGTS